jgi:hypothetical protein
MTTLFIDQEAIQSALKETAGELQAHYLRQEGEFYRSEDLQRALNQWLELSIESLVDDVLFHTVEGDRSYSFNREAFDAQMRRMKPAKRLVSGELPSPLPSHPPQRQAA